MNKIKVIGLGPGHPDYVLPKAKKEIEALNVLVGGKRNLFSLDTGSKTVYEIKGSLENMNSFIKENLKNSDIGVVVSGDTGFYSMLRYIKRNYPDEQIEVVPGLSSIQYMFSRINESWEDACLTSLHGREIDLKNVLQKYNKVGILTDNKWKPQNIAKKLLKEGYENKIMYVGENLSYDDERITKGSLQEIINAKPFNMCVVVITDEK